MTLALVEAVKNISNAMEDRNWLLIVVFSFLSLVAEAQADASFQLELLTDVYISQNRAIDVVKAWKIQLMSSTDRRKVEAEEKQFEQRFWEYNANWTHDDPYYVLTVNNLAHSEKIDILHTFYRIKKAYPSALLILADVKKADLSD